MTLSIHGKMPHGDGAIELTDAAAGRARMSFNPSQNPRVDRLKTLAAAFYTELNEITKLAREQGNDTAGREAATAMTHIQSGAMFAVSAVTEPGFMDDYSEPAEPEADSKDKKSKKAKKDEETDPLS